MALNEWSYDTAQPPLVYTAKVGGKKPRIVSVATMEGVWFAYDAATGRPIYQRVKVIDRTEHPPLQPGKPVAVFPSLARRPELLAGVVRPGDELHLQRRVRDRGGRRAGEADADAEEAQAPARRRLPRARRTATSARCCRAGTTTARSARSTSRTGKRVWKFTTPEPERGGVTTTDSGLGFAGGGDGVLRAFDLKTGKVLWTFQTGHQIAAGAVDLLGRRQGVHRDHRRRHADLVERRHGERAAGVRARRLAEAVAAAGCCRRRLETRAGECGRSSRHGPHVRGCAARRHGTKRSAAGSGGTDRHAGGARRPAVGRELVERPDDVAGASC